MKKILVVLTNVSQYGTDEEKTGLWLKEATEFVAEVTRKGYDVDYVSPKGTQVYLDPRSMKRIYVSKEDKEILNSTDFQKRALESSLTPSEINPDDYRAIYYTGGHGVLWDFPDNEELQEVSAAIYQNGGYVTSVCHGVAGLLNIKLSDGEFLIKGKEMTGFTNSEEKLSGKEKKVPFSTEDEVIKRGAYFKKKLPFCAYAVQDGRLITGQNPMSGGKVAELLMKNI